MGSEGEPPLGDKTKFGPRGRKSRTGNGAGSRAVLFLRNFPSPLCAFGNGLEVKRRGWEAAPGARPRPEGLQPGFRGESGNGGLSSAERGALIPSFLGQRRGGSPGNWSCGWERPELEVIHRVQQWLPTARGCQTYSAGVGMGVRGCQICSAGVGMGVGACTPAGSGMRDENEPLGAGGFKELYFIADHRGRIASCLKEKNESQI